MSREACSFGARVLGRAFVLLGVVCGASGLAFGQTWEAAPLPATLTFPRDPEAYQQAVSEAERGETLASRFPQLFGAMRAHWRKVLAPFKAEACSGDYFETILSELWTDYGDPELNEANQWYFLGLLEWSLSHDCGLNPDPGVCERVTEGLLAYYNAGGGRYYPEFEARFAWLLNRVAPQDPAVMQAVADLIDDAVIWAASVGDERPFVWDTIERAGKARYGDVFPIYAYDLIESTTPLPASVPACYQRALKSIRRLASARAGQIAHVRREVRRVIRLIRADCGGTELRRRLVCRLLVTVRVLLDRIRPPGMRRTAEDVLLELLHNRDCLTSAQEWRLWSDVLEALGPERASGKLLTALSARLKTDDSIPSSQADLLRRWAVQRAAEP